MNEKNNATLYRAFTFLNSLTGMNFKDTQSYKNICGRKHTNISATRL
jgi:hypothetical protein